MCQIPTKTLKKNAIRNSRLHSLKIFIHQKGAEKLVKYELDSNS